MPCSCLDVSSGFASIASSINLNCSFPKSLLLAVLFRSATEFVLSYLFSRKYSESAYCSGRWNLSGDVTVYFKCVTQSIANEFDLFMLKDTRLGQVNRRHQS